MKLEVKYGLLITVGLIAWTVVAHLLVRDPCSALHTLGPLVFFNVLEFAGIYLGESARKRDNGNQLQFKAGLKTGIGIAVVYGISSCLFFLALLAVVGSGLLCLDPAIRALPLWKVAAFSFVAQFCGALILGLVYSVIIAFILASRRRVSA
ncbi:MAG: DUF4199 family protein [Acidobacteriota bacterium]|nr:DUF4199 family protein [Acidobacteriota bacterium]